MFGSDSKDSYSFSGMASGWFSTMFEDDLSRFPFIGAREKLLQMQNEKGLGRRIAEVIGRRIKITSLLNLITDHLLGLKLPPGSEPNKLAEELIKVMDEEKTKHSIERFLADTQRDCRKHKRYFESVAVFKSFKEAKLFDAVPAFLQGQMIVVSGQLVHRSAIGQYNDRMVQTVANLPGEWLLSDFPPLGMASANTRFEGKAIALAIEKEFEELFGKYLPYRRDYGWYPYVRVTGFSTSRAMDKACLP